MSIAGSLSIETKILLDEPCLSLDVKNTIFIEEMLMKLKKEYTIIIVTHNLAQINDNIIFMDNKIDMLGREELNFLCR